MFNIKYKRYTIHSEYVFRIARGARSETPVILTAIEYDGIVGYGEASMPPLYGESHASAVQFMDQVDLSGFSDPFDIDSMMQYIDGIAPGNTAAKSAIDIALHDIAGKLANQPCYQYFGLPDIGKMSTSYTIGIDTPDIIRKKIADAEQYNFLKIKLGSDQDEQIIQAVRSVTDVPLFVDANQGWADKNQALEKIHWLKDVGVVLVEQPTPVALTEDMRWLKDKSPLPIIGDESIQRLVDVDSAEPYFHGINIKLSKSTGLNEGLKMAKLAKEKGLKVMLGCMTETSCAISAAFHLAPLADWIDLDGNMLITDNPYQGIQTIDGQLVNNQIPGIGLVEPENFWA